MASFVAFAWESSRHDETSVRKRPGGIHSGYLLLALRSSFALSTRGR